MEVQCKDRERIFEQGVPEEWAALEAHAASCAACGRELRAWRALSEGAALLCVKEDEPTLWPRIESALAGAALPEAQPSRSRRWVSAWNWPLAPVWQAAAAAVLIAALAAGAGWLYLARPVKREPVATDRHLLANPALKEVEQAQDAYVKAIARLAASAEPQLEKPATPLMGSYREKLLVLDGAIAELEAQAQQNPSNAHLREELLAMYREKQNTLESVLEAKQP